jgi:hypothetical protein
MRAIGRVVLIMLIPAGLALAALVQYLGKRGHAVWGWSVALACLLEQGITTESYDVAANQEKLTRIASRITPGQQAFFYHPFELEIFYNYQVDAMWASLMTGVPTINGYTGYYPPGWEGFFLLDTDPFINAEEVLLKWEQTRGLSHERVQWIGMDFQRPSLPEWFSPRRDPKEPEAKPLIPAS